MLGFGSNSSGQLSIPGSDEVIRSPTPISFDSSVHHLVRICCNASQTDIVTDGGVLYTCGDNENNELGRTGKRSILQRVDALETAQITDVAIG
jgi:alpha-tubulin suppressor-like RCC1 family protein